MAARRRFIDRYSRQDLQDYQDRKLRDCTDRQVERDLRARCYFVRCRALQFFSSFDIAQDDRESLDKRREPWRRLIESNRAPLRIVFLVTKVKRVTRFQRP